MRGFFAASRAFRYLAQTPGVGGRQLRDATFVGPGLTLVDPLREGVAMIRKVNRARGFRHSHVKTFLERFVDVLFRGDLVVPLHTVAGHSPLVVRLTLPCRAVGGRGDPGPEDYRDPSPLRIVQRSGHLLRAQFAVHHYHLRFPGDHVMPVCRRHGYRFVQTKHQFGGLPAHGLVFQDCSLNWREVSSRIEKDMLDAVRIQDFEKCFCSGILLHFADLQTPISEIRNSKHEIRN